MKEIIELFTSDTSWTTTQKVVAISMIMMFFGTLFWFLKHYWDDLFRYFVTRRKHFYKNIHPALANKKDYQDLLKNYISSRWQDQNPDLYEQLTTNHQFAVASRNLIDDFLTFFEDEEAPKRNLILGGTGMGKSTFMLKLYLKYYMKYFKKYKIHLIQVQLCKDSPHLEQLIKEISDQQNAILLIDGMDEDPESIKYSTNLEGKNFKNRLRKIVEWSNAFHFLIITARTQLFPDESSSLPYFQIQTSLKKEPVKLNRHYISPFTKNDVQEYISKGFNYFPFLKNYKQNKIRQRKAKDMTEKFNDIFHRPLIISYLDRLIEENHLFEVDLYESIIERWIFEREYKRSNQEDSSEKFLAQLLKFSHLTAVKIYNNRHKHNKLEEQNSISYEELNEVYTELEFKNAPDSYLSKEEARVQSLITRVNDNFKMVHKSFLEYFLAIQCFNDKNFAKQFEFSSYEQCHKFFNELLMKDYISKKLDDELKKKYDDLSDLEKITLHHSILRIDNNQRNLLHQPLGNFDFRNALLSK